MGLDQYLSVRRSVFTHEHNGPEARETLLKVADAASLLVTPESTMIEVSVRVAYWRKANQIHGWIVDNATCIEEDISYVLRIDHLRELRDVCTKVIATARTEHGKVSNGYRLAPDGSRIPILEDGTVVTNAAEIEALLPPMPGFFFGSYDIDGHYLDQVSRTVLILNPLIDRFASSDDVDFPYHASW